jgi:hypothetical protein
VSQSEIGSRRCGNGMVAVSERERSGERRRGKKRLNSETATATGPANGAATGREEGSRWVGPLGAVAGAGLTRRTVALILWCPASPNPTS